MTVRIHPTALVEADVQIGDGSALWDNVHVRSGAKLGRNCIVGEKTYIAGGVVVGDLVKINACAYLCAGVIVHDGAMIAAHVVFTNDRRPRATDRDITALLSSAPGPETETTVVGRGATLGANATIGPGVTIGDYAMVGMGSVVTRDVPAHALVVGNPAQIVGLVARDGTPVLRLPRGQALPQNARLACPDDGFLVVEGGRARWEAASAAGG